ncbi:MAG: hypothetical protein AC479_02990 [miscellaneous Crenarchaeota group-6 archaeon AD8-1]|nr:MAG: hypothetical protein AC479_02990 [miscellaneous Crenarchaeota group-6 archaeon AD8-1]
MSEHDTIEKIKSKQGILDKIQNFFTLGYGTKEDLRELDKKLRDLMYEDFRRMRHEWEDIYLEALNEKVAFSGSKLKKVIQIIDRVMEKVRHADYGYAGLMDRKGHIREEELARVLNYDKELSVDVDNISQSIDEIYSKIENEDWTTISSDVKNVKNLLLAFEDKLQQREEKYRPFEV